jgi:hypothetical protein
VVAEPSDIDREVLKVLASISGAATSAKVSARMGSRLSSQAVGARMRRLIEMGFVSDTLTASAVRGSANASLRPASPQPSGGGQAYRITPEGRKALQQ